MEFFLTELPLKIVPLYKFFFVYSSAKTFTRFSYLICRVIITSITFICFKLGDSYIFFIFINIKDILRKISNHYYMINYSLNFNPKLACFNYNSVDLGSSRILWLEFDWFFVLAESPLKTFSDFR